MLSSRKSAKFSTPRLLPPLPKPNFFQQNDWGQCALRGLRDLLHVISPDGRIQYVSASCKLLIGYERIYLLGRVIHSFIHPDDVDVFCKELSEVMLYGISTRFIYRFWTRDNDWTILESQCNIFRDPNDVLNRSRLILMARPYFTKNGPRFDSFLEYKVGNEQLRQQLMQLKSEDSDTDSDCDAASTQAMDGEPVDLDESEYVQQFDAACSSPERKPSNDATIMPSRTFPERPADEETFLGDLGIPILKKARKIRAGKYKLKKSKTAQRICTACATIQSPEWRRGPHGPKTLCNACGCKMNT